mgnify:CR=1 FL=1
MSYTPNFTDPRTKRRVISAITFCKKYLREDREQSLGNRWIHHKDNFGNQRNELSRYLRDQLLICSDLRYNKDLKISKKYILNKKGLELLEDIVDITKQQHTYSVVEVANKFQQELDSGIEYNDSSDRKWHWLQNHPRQEKRRVLADTGLVHNYDIICSCPQLLHQYAQQIPEILDPTQLVKSRGQQPRALWRQGPMDLYLSNLRYYLVHRKSIRQQLAIETEVDESVIKRLINGLFQGGQISAYPNSRCYKELNADIAKIQFLQQHEFIIGLKEDIKVIWDYIKPVMYLGKKRNGTNAGISGKQKTALYRILERRVLNSVELYLKETNNRYYLEHDGWTTANEIDRNSLQEFVRNQTGFDIEFDYEMLDITKQQHTYSVVEVANEME